MDCEYIETESSDTALLTVAYVMAGVCGLCLLPIFVLLVQASCKRRKQQQQQQQQATSGTDQPSDRTNLRNDFYNNYWAQDKHYSKRPSRQTGSKHPHRGSFLRESQEKWRKKNRNQI